MKTLIALFCVGTFMFTNASMQRNNPVIKIVWTGGEHSEGPNWSVEENALYWVDISQQKVHRLDPATNNVTTRVIGYGPVTPVVNVAGAPGKLIIGVRTEVYLLAWDSAPEDSSLRLITALDLGLPNNRMNDGKVDAKGRLWIGTMGKETAGNVDLDQASLYVVTQDNYLHPPVMVKPVSVSNGLAWTRDNKFMFYIDSPTGNVDVFDYNLETGTIKNRRTIFSFAANNITGVPDGMTIDTDDNLWVACFNGGQVIKIDSRAGSLLERHALPVEKITSVSWGGENLDILYVTTSKVDLTAAEIIQQPEAGAVFAIEGTGAKGWPAYQYAFREVDNY